MVSCYTDEEYEDFNRDPDNPTEVSADFLFTSATVDLVDQMTSANVNLNVFRFLAQYWTATTYLDEPNYDLTNRGIPDNHWYALYANVLYDLKDAKSAVMEDEFLSEEEKAARIAQIEVLMVYTWQVLVDTFGDIPYTEALNAAEFPLPAYDDASEIYVDLIARISDAAATLDGSAVGFTDADLIYQGEMDKWSKFANSLKLRLGMRLSEVNPDLAQSVAESAISAGVFTSNDDNAVVVYTGTYPNTNPLWDDLVRSGRSDYLPANTIVDYMNALEDPRRDDYFDTNLGIFKGGIYGASNSFPEYTHVGTSFLDPTTPGILLDYAEVEFYMAEAAERGFGIPGTAEEHYNQAIMASIDYWGGTEAEALAYIQSPEVEYSTPEVSPLYQIGKQFWIAMYNNPFQGWSVWRKFDAPGLNVAADSGLPVPLRYTYPVSEQNLNPTQYEAASLAIGGDRQQTAIFWDVPGNF